MQIGYARVSSTDQDFDAQVERLKAHGCEKVFSEKASGRSTNGRHELLEAAELVTMLEDKWGAVQTGPPGALPMARKPTEGADIKLMQELIFPAT